MLSINYSRDVVLIGSHISYTATTGAVATT